MPIYNVPRRGVEYIFPLELVSQSTGQFQVDPTLAAGDFKISKDFGALANLATLPTVEPAGGRTLKVIVDSTEMTADNIKIIAVDAAGDEWDEVSITIQPSTRNLDDLAFPTVSGRSTDVSAGGEVGIDWANVGSPTTTVNLSGTTVKTATDVETDTANIQTRLPAALSGDGFIKADLKSIDDELTTGNNATLNLKQMNIQNNTGTAFVSWSTGGDGDGISAIGHNFGNGVSADGAAGIQASGELADGITAYTNAPNANGASFYGDGTGHGIDAQSGTGKSINAPQDIAVSDGNLTLAAIAAAVWANATRTLTSFGTLVADIWALAIETGYTAKQSMRLMLSALAGKLSGAATTTVTIRSATDAKDRIVATVDEDGNRSAVTHDTTD